LTNEFPHTMSKRKSTSGSTPNRVVSEFGNNSASASKTTRSNPSFALIKCHVCQVEYTTKDKSKHDESICKALIESALELATDDFSESSANLWECPFMLNGHIVVSPYVVNISKGWCFYSSGI